jgi:hypothetical protein
MFEFVYVSLLTLGICLDRFSIRIYNWIQVYKFVMILIIDSKVLTEMYCSCHYYLPLVEIMSFY